MATKKPKPKAAKPTKAKKAKATKKPKPTKATKAKAKKAKERRFVVLVRPTRAAKIGWWPKKGSAHEWATVECVDGWCCGHMIGLDTSKALKESQVEKAIVAFLMERVDGDSPAEQRRAALKLMKKKKWEFRVVEV